MKIVSLGDLKRWTSAIVNDVQKAPVIVSVHGRPRALVLKITQQDIESVVRGDVADLKIRALKSYGKKATARGKKGATK